MDGLEILEYNGSGYFAPFKFERWRIAFLNSAERFTKQGITYLERHTKTDEVFVLINGQATLLVGEAGSEIDMVQGKLYVIKQNQWHNIVVSEDAKILIVENADTGKENTEYIEFGYEMVK